MKVITIGGEHMREEKRDEKPKDEKPKIENEENETEATSEAKLKILVGAYYDVQKVRIMQSLRVQDLTRRGVLDEKRAETLHEYTDKRLENSEKDIALYIKTLVERQPIWTEWLKDVNGIGPILAGGLIAFIGDISRFDTISKLWAYAGEHTLWRCKNCEARAFPNEVEKNRWMEKTFLRLKEVNERATKKEKANEEALRAKVGKMVCSCEHPEAVQERARRKKGELMEWNPYLKTHCWKISDAFVKKKGAYRSLYDKFRAEEDRNHPELTDGHRFARATRRTVKVFLAHYWIVARKQKGLSTRPPYAIERLGHQDLIGPLMDGPGGTYMEIEKYKDRPLSGPA
jgi:hypothetical protein